MKNPIIACFVLIGAVVLSACAPITPTATAAPTHTAVIAPVATETALPPRPIITDVQLKQDTVGRYEMLDITVAAQVAQVNPYDARLIQLNGLFTGPDGTQAAIPGFWNGKDSWHIRFTPSQVGEWRYELMFKDPGGISPTVQGQFTVTASNLHGAIQVGSKVDAAFSSRYLVYQDGTPFYGLGHVENPSQSISALKAANENYIVWWPLYGDSLIGNSYSQYAVPAMESIDKMVNEAEKEKIILIFTVWAHIPGSNGFNQLGDTNTFFTSEEAWAWQENLYRYIIARWGYSTSIGMWQTASEINGPQPWHEKVNAYFQNNDPYQHPITASMAPDANWPEGQKVLNVPQVHVYDFKNGDAKVDVVHAAEVIANWTTLMWTQAEKPNWIGEFGVPGDQDYPELFHNVNWAALAAGAAMIPAERNGDGGWGKMTPQMIADMERLSRFVGEIPLVKLNPSPLKIVCSNDQVRGWGVAGADGGLFWVQDFSLEGKSTDSVRRDKSVRVGTIQISGLAAGTYTITPYDTWQGLYRTAIEVTCKEDVACQIKMPKFHADLAFKIEKK